MPVRGGEDVDEELLSIIRQGIAANDRPRMWATPILRQACLDSQGGRRPAWLDDPLLHETYPDGQNEEVAAEFARLTPEQIKDARRTLESDGRNAMRLRAAGIRVVLGTDTGQLRHGIGYFAYLELECLVTIGMTGNRRCDARLRRHRPPEFWNGRGRQERGFHRPRRESTRGHRQHAKNRPRLYCGVRKSIEPACGRSVPCPLPARMLLFLPAIPIIQLLLLRAS